MEPAEPNSRVVRYGDDVFEAVISMVSWGMSIRKAAAAYGVSPSTVERWVVQSRAGKPHGVNDRPRHPGRETFHQRRQHGQSVQEAATAVGVSSMCGYKWDEEMRTGASAPVRTVGQTRAYNQKVRAHQLLAGTDTNPRLLTLDEREKIRDLRAAGASMRQVAAQLGRPHSTISREIARNCDATGRYLTYGAQRMAAERRARPKAAKLAGDSPLRS